MKLVFLCGGIGKRMFPLTEDKFLFKFLGKTLLEHQIEKAMRSGFRGFVIVGNEFNIEKIKGICNGVKADIELAVQEEPRGMADALLTTKPVLDGEEIIVVNPNDVFDDSVYQTILGEYERGIYESYVIGYRVHSYFPGGYLEVNDEDELIKIHEKPGEGNEPSNLVNIVVHLHRDVETLLRYLEEVESVKDDVYEGALSRMVNDGHGVKVVHYDGFWHAIKYPWDLFKVVEYFLNGIKVSKVSQSARVSEGATVDDSRGNVVIDDDVQVFENAVIRGPCYVGRNSVIGNNVLIWNYSHIGDNCVAGYSSEIKHSYVGDNCWFHMSYVGDSIISNNCSFGAGTITANFRFDERSIKISISGKKNDSHLEKLGVIMGENCKTGINSGTMPGVKVGPNSIIGPGVILSEDLEPNKVVLLKEKEYVVKQNEVKLSPEKKLELRNKLLKYGYETKRASKK